MSRFSRMTCSKKMRPVTGRSSTCVNANRPSGWGPGSDNRRRGHCGRTGSAAAPASCAAAGRSSSRPARRRCAVRRRRLRRGRAGRHRRACPGNVPVDGGGSPRRGGPLVVGPGGYACRHWSSRHRGLATLIRHAMGGVARHGSRAGTAPAPALRTQGVRRGPAPRALVALGGMALRLHTALATARAITVALPRLHGTPCSRQRAHRYSRAGRSMGTPVTPKCWTDSSRRATLLWHRLPWRGAVVEFAGLSDRCRANFLWHRPRCTATGLRDERRCMAQTPRTCPSLERPSLPGPHAGRPGRLDPWTVKPRSPGSVGPAYWRTATSPANSVGY